MKRTALLILFGILTSCTLALAEQGEEENEALLFRSLGYGVWATQIADIVSTELFLRRGWDETNPLWENDHRRRFIAYPLKLGLAWAVNEGTDQLHQTHLVLATLIRMGIVGGLSVVLTNNLQLSMTVRF